MRGVARIIAPACPSIETMPNEEHARPSTDRCAGGLGRRCRLRSRERRPEHALADELQGRVERGGGCHPDQQRARHGAGRILHFAAGPAPLCPANANSSRLLRASVAMPGGLGDEIAGIDGEDSAGDQQQQRQDLRDRRAVRPVRRARRRER